MKCSSDPWHTLYSFVLVTVQNCLIYGFTLTYCVTLLRVLPLRIPAISEGNSRDILCDTGRIFGCQAGINLHGCIPGLFADLAGNLFACWWVGCRWTSKKWIFYSNVVTGMVTIYVWIYNFETNLDQLLTFIEKAVLRANKGNGLCSLSVFWNVLD